MAVDADVTGIGSARTGMAGCGYGINKGIFGFSDAGTTTATFNLISDTGVVANDTTVVSINRANRGACSYGSGTL